MKTPNPQQQKANHQALNVNADTVEKNSTAAAFVDQRQEALTQSSWQDLIQNSPKVKQLMVFQNLANQSPLVKTRAASHDIIQRNVKSGTRDGTRVRIIDGLHRGELASISAEDEEEGGYHVITEAGGLRVFCRYNQLDLVDEAEEPDEYSFEEARHNTKMAEAPPLKQETSGGRMLRTGTMRKRKQREEANRQEQFRQAPKHQINTRYRSRFKKNKTSGVPSEKILRPRFCNFQVATDDTKLWHRVQSKSGWYPKRPSWGGADEKMYRAAEKNAASGAAKKDGKRWLYRTIHKAKDGTPLYLPRKKDRKRKTEDYIDIDHRRSWMKVIVAQLDQEEFEVAFEGETFWVRAYRWTEVEEVYRIASNLQFMSKSKNRGKGGSGLESIQEYVDEED